MNQTIGGINAFNKNTFDSLQIKPPFPITFLVIKKSITNDINAVLVNNAADCLIANEILNLVFVDIFSKSTIK